MLRLSVELLLLTVPLFDYLQLLGVPLNSSFDKRVMFQVELLQFFWSWRYQLVAAEPADEVRVDVEFVRVVELIEHNSTRWQPMVRVVLVILVSKLINTDFLTTQSVIFRLHIASTPLGSLASKSQHGRLQLFKQECPYFIHFL